MKHTVNIAAGLTIVILDDRGRPVEQFIFPFALFFFSLPALVYRWLRGFRVPADLAGFFTALLPGGWREDMRLMGLALLDLFSPQQLRPAEVMIL